MESSFVYIYIKVGSYYGWGVIGEEQCKWKEMWVCDRIFRYAGI